LGTSDKTLTQEPHNFGRVFSGAWYECFCKLFKSNYKLGQLPTALEAVKAARDLMVRTLLNAALIAPNQLQFFQAMATSMVSVLESQSKHAEAEILKKVFIRRQLWVENPKGVAAPTLVKTINIDPSASPNHMHTNLGATADSSSKIITVELPKLALIDEGQSIHTILGSTVSNFLNYINSQSLLGPMDQNNMFGITDDNKLVRNYICSSFRALPQLSESVFPSGIAS
jgi:hypothetical protein